MNTHTSPPLPVLSCLQDILAYEGGATLTVEGQELGPGDLKILRDFQAPAGTKPGGLGGCWVWSVREQTHALVDVGPADLRGHQAGWVAVLHIAVLR